MRRHRARRKAASHRYRTTRARRQSGPRAKSQKAKARTVRAKKRRPTPNAQSPQARADRVLRRMEKGASLSTAARRERIKPSTVTRLAGHKLRQDRPGGRFRVAKTGRRVRTLQIRTDDGELVRVPVATLAKARELSRYENAIGHFLRTGDASRLTPFTGKTVVTEDGRRVTLLTDPKRLRELAAADSLRLDSLYADLT